MLRTPRQDLHALVALAGGMGSKPDVGSDGK
jgi:hypothetical protein